MSGLRLQTVEEALASFEAAPADAEQLVHPRIRPHCATCGKWVPEASVRKVWPRPWEADENEYTGTCKTHGERVDVVWDEG